MQPCCRRLALARRTIRELAALAEKRAAAVSRRNAGPRRFRPLSEREVADVVGADLLTRLATAMRHP